MPSQMALITRSTNQKRVFWLAVFTRSYGGNILCAKSDLTKKAEFIFQNSDLGTRSDKMLGTNQLRKIASKGIVKRIYFFSSDNVISQKNIFN